MTASSSDWLQPPRFVVWPKTRPRTASPVAERDSRLEDLDGQVRAVLELIERPDAEEQAEQAEGPQRSRLAGAAGPRLPIRHPPTAENRRTANFQPDRRRSPTRSRSTGPASRARPPAAASGRRPTSASIGKPNVHWNGSTGGESLRPVGHERHRDEPAGQQQLQGEEDVEDRPDPGRPERHEAEQPEHQRAEHVGAPDRDEEDDDVDRPGRSIVGWKISARNAASGSQQDDDDGFPAGQGREVDVERVDRSEEHAAQLALPGSAPPRPMASARCSCSGRASRRCSTRRTRRA